MAYAQNGQTLVNKVANNDLVNLVSLMPVISSTTEVEDLSIQHLQHLWRRNPIGKCQSTPMNIRDVHYPHVLAGILARYLAWDVTTLFYSTDDGYGLAPGTRWYGSKPVRDKK